MTRPLPELSATIEGVPSGYLPTTAPQPLISARNNQQTIDRVLRYAHAVHIREIRRRIGKVVVNQDRLDRGKVVSRRSRSI